MSALKMERLGSFCATGTGGTPSRSNLERYYEGGTIPWVKSGELREAIIHDTEEHVTEAALRETNVKLVPAGTLLLAMYGASVGRLAVLGVPATTNQAVCHIIPDPKAADGRYLFHALRNQVANLVARGVGGAQPNISQGIVKNLILPLPPLVEQRRIGTVLDRAEALRAKRRAALGQFDGLIQAIFLDLFIGPQDSSWPRIALPLAFWFQEGPGVRKWQFKAEGVKLLNVGNIEKDGSLDLTKTDRYLSEGEAYCKYKHFLVDAGDLVIASSGISFDEDGMLRTRGAFISKQDLPLCMNTSTIRFKAIEGVSDLRFLWVWLNSNEFRNQITKLVTGSAQQNFGPSHLSSLTITLPPLSVQHEFGCRVAAVEKLKTAHRASLARMDALFAALQHRAFRGEL